MGKDHATTPDPEPPTEVPPAGNSPDPGVAMTTVTWDGQDWSVPESVDDWPFDAAVALEQGKAMVFLTALLGPQQMRTFRRGQRRTSRDGALLMNQIMVDAYGASTGE